MVEHSGINLTVLGLVQTAWMLNVHIAFDLLEHAWLVNVHVALGVGETCFVINVHAALQLLSNAWLPNVHVASDFLKHIHSQQGISTTQACSYKFKHSQKQHLYAYHTMLNMPTWFHMFNHVPACSSMFPHVPSFNIQRSSSRHLEGQGVGEVSGRQHTVE